MLAIHFYIIPTVLLYTRESPPPGKPQGENTVELENTKNFRDPKKQNFEKISKTFRGTIVGKL